jgi:glycine/D-amino acid oxidase-like deaminating enzyme
MDTTSVWRATAPETGFAMLQGDVSADVLVVGGGITGVTLALLLARQGRSVVLLEADAVGNGSTGNSTGNLYETLSQGLHGVASRWNQDVARQVVARRRAAVDFIEDLSRGADCGFRRCALYLWATTESERAAIADEFSALSQAGCNVSLEREVPRPLPQPVRDAVVLQGQAQFNPQAYVAQLSRLAVQAGARLHEHSRVVDIDFKEKRAVTATGSVKAHEIVLATHTPKGFHVVQAEMPVHREYGIARELGAADPGPGIFWYRGNEHYSVRTHEADGRRFLVCIGQEHKTGGHNAKAGLMALASAVEKQYGPAETAWAWSAQNYRAADGLPYIGRDLRGAYIATGFSTDGLVWGTVGAQVIAEQLMGGTPEFGELCKPGRFSPVKGAKTILEEVGTMTSARW